MSKADANAILAAAREGHPIPAQLIRKALQATGDVAGRWGGKRITKPPAQPFDGLAA